MPWKIGVSETPYYAFISVLFEGTSTFSAVCRAHGVSRPTGYKWLRRFLESGLEGLREHSRRPQHLGRAIEHEVRQVVESAMRKHPTWGARKIVALLRKQYPCRQWPHPRTIERWQPWRGRQRRIAIPVLQPRRAKVRRCHDVWTIDFKGWFKTGDGTRCEPLTARDAHSCYLLCAQHVACESETEVRRVIRGVFEREGLPRTIHVDNGPPFGGTGALGLSKLSVWWLQLGIRVEYSRPGRPGDNAAHEQMHRVLKADTAAPPRATLRAQNRRLEQWRKEYNLLRPHEKWDQSTPAEHYQRSSRRYPSKLPTWKYGRSDPTRRVSKGGWISWHGQRRLIGRAFGGHTIALVDRGSYHLVYLGSHILGELHRHDVGGIRPFRYSHRRQGRYQSNKCPQPRSAPAARNEQPCCLH